MKIILDCEGAPDDIERRSFEIIDAETGGKMVFPDLCWHVARRCIHACGDTSILRDLHISPAAVEAGIEAMRGRCAIFTDTRMLAAGLVDRRMRPLGIEVTPLMALPKITEKARQAGCTRARMGIKMLAAQMSGAIVAIGNAPTALMALLEELEAPHLEPPALIIGMPVGFVNAAQSKELLRRSPWTSISIEGRKGGSAMAAACVNALADLALAREAGALQDKDRCEKTKK